MSSRAWIFRNRIALIDFVLMFGRHRALLTEMMRREMRERAIGQSFGGFWIFAQPIIVTLAYVTVFAFVFNGRAKFSQDGSGDYVVYLLSGLIPWLVTSEVLGRASFAVSGNPGYVKQMVFPVEVLPVRLFGPAIVMQALATCVLVGYDLFTGRGFSFTWLLWPLALIIELAVLLGLAYALAAIGVFFRDIREIIQLYLTVGLFISPILYPLDAAPTALRVLAYLNPITPVILMFQDLMIHRALAHPLSWIAAACLALVAIQLGYGLFRRLRPIMSDAL